MFINVSRMFLYKLFFQVYLPGSCYLSVAAEFNIPVWFEPVSVTKSRRIVSIAKYVSILVAHITLSISPIYTCTSVNKDHDFIGPFCIPQRSRAHRNGKRLIGQRIVLLHAERQPLDGVPVRNSQTRHLGSAEKRSQNTCRDARPERSLLMLRGWAGIHENHQAFLCGIGGSSVRGSFSRPFRGSREAHRGRRLLGRRRGFFDL